MYINEIGKIVYQLKNKIKYNYILFDKNMEIVGKNINTDGSEIRENLKKVARTGEIVISTGLNSGRYIPILYKEQLEYIVYIKEDEKGKKENVYLIKSYLELFISKNREKSKELLKGEIEKSFLVELLAMGDLECFEFIYQKAKLLKFDINRKRRIILIDLISFEKRFQYTLEREEKVNRIIEEVRKTIQKFLKMDEYCYNIFEDKFVVIKNYSSDKEIEEFLLRVAKRIKKVCDFDIISFVSDGCSGAENYSIQYKKLLKLHRIYAFESLKPRKIIFSSTDEVEVFFRSLNEKQKKEFLQIYKQKVMKYIEDGNEKLLKTIEVFFRNDMDTLKTSKLLEIHRNTVNYRLKKFITDTKIDITRPYQCMKIYIILCMIKKNGIDNNQKM